MILQRSRFVSTVSGTLNSATCNDKITNNRAPGSPLGTLVVPLGPEPLLHRQFEPRPLVLPRRRQLIPARHPLLARVRARLIRGRELGEYAAAIADLERASVLRPEWPEPYLQRGLFHRFNGTSSQALAELGRFVELAPPGYWRDEASRQIAAIEGENAADGVV